MYTRQKSAVLPEQIFVIVMTERNETLTRSGEICLGLIPIQPEVSYPAHLQGQRRRCNLEEEHLAPQFLESHSKDPVTNKQEKSISSLS
jgi:hypothetical protein